jgi:hypothetical protein
MKMTAKNSLQHRMLRKRINDPITIYAEHYRFELNRCRIALPQARRLGEYVEIRRVRTRVRAPSLSSA